MGITGGGKELVGNNLVGMTCEEGTGGKELVGITWWEGTGGKELVGMNLVGRNL